jgi:hypothetical protein
MAVTSRFIVSAALLLSALVLGGCLEDPVVVDVQLITLHPDSVEIVLGTSTTITAEGRGRLGEVVPDLSVTWNVVGPAGIVEIVSSTTTGQNPSITVRGVQVGTTYVRANAESGAGRTGAVVVLPEG